MMSLTVNNILLGLLVVVIVGCLVLGCSFRVNEHLESKVSLQNADKSCSGMNEEQCRTSPKGACQWVNGKCLVNPINSQKNVSTPVV